jgi:hypothetical protein
MGKVISILSSSHKEHELKLEQLQKEQDKEQDLAEQNKDSYNLLKKKQQEERRKYNEQVIKQYQINRKSKPNTNPS